MICSDLLKCSICYLDYNNTRCIPKLLPDCGHTICSRCLDKIFETQHPPKCPLDRKQISSKNRSHYCYPTNEILVEFLEEQSSVQDGICLTHQEPNTLVCLLDRVKICRYCVDGNDDAKHQGHETMLLSDVREQAEKKAKELQMVMEKWEADQEKVLELLEEKKNEALRTKKRKFDKIREFVDRKAEEAWSDIGLVFSQKKVKTEVQFKKDLEFRQQVRIQMSVLGDGRMDEEFFNALNNEGGRDKDFLHEEKNKIDMLSQRLESELNLTGNGLEKSFISAFKQYGPKIRQLQVNQNDINIEEEVADSLLESQVNSRLELKRKGGCLQIACYSPAKEHSVNIVPLLTDSEEFDAVKLDLRRRKLTEDITSAIFYIWKRLNHISELEIDLGNDGNMDSEISAFLANDFWASKEIKAFTLILHGNYRSKTDFKDTTAITMFTDTLTKMTNLSFLSLDFSYTNLTDQPLIVLASVILPQLKKLETFEIKLNMTKISAEGFTRLCSNMHSNIKAVSFGLGSTTVGNEALKALIQHALPKLGTLERFELNMVDAELNENDFDDFFLQLGKFMKSVKIFSLNATNTTIFDSSIKMLANNVLSGMYSLENLRLKFKYDWEVTDKGLGKIFKYCQPYQLKTLRLYAGNRSVTDLSLLKFAQLMLPKMLCLENLELTCWNSRITDSAATELWINLASFSKQIQSFKFSFKDTKVTDASFEIFIANDLFYMSNLKKLVLHICENFSDKMIGRFFTRLKNIAPSLENLHLNFDSDEWITDASFGILSKDVIPLMVGLRKFKLMAYRTKLTIDVYQSMCEGLEKLQGLEFVSIEHSMSAGEVERLKAKTSIFQFKDTRILYF